MEDRRGLEKPRRKERRDEAGRRRLLGKGTEVEGLSGIICSKQSV